MYEELADCLAWWKDRQENERAWKVDVKGLVRRDDQGRVISCNLDIKNPHSGETVDHRSPTEIVDSIIEKERRILAIMDDIKATLGEGGDGLASGQTREVLDQDLDYVTDLEPKTYKKLSVKLYGKGVLPDKPVEAHAVRMKKHQIAKEGQVIVSEIWAKKGAIGIVPPNGSGALCYKSFLSLQSKT